MRSTILASTEKHYHAVQFYKDESSLAGTAAHSSPTDYAVDNQR